MKAKKIMDATTNNSVYNKTRKVCLERSGLIRCAWCPYHGNENDTNKYYGIIVNWRSKLPKTIYPNWKLVSKNRKQWMKKNLKIKKTKNYYKFDF